MITNEYDKMAEDFLAEHNATIVFEPMGKKMQPWNMGYIVDAYRFTIEREEKEYSGTFYTSYKDTRDGIGPTAYDVLACVQKHEVGTYREFCEKHGYDIYDSDSEETYKQVLAEEMGIRRLFGDCMEELREII